MNWKFFQNKQKLNAAVGDRNWKYLYRRKKKQRRYQTISSICLIRVSEVEKHVNEIEVI